MILTIDESLSLRYGTGLRQNLDKEPRGFSFLLFDSHWKHIITNRLIIINIKRNLKKLQIIKIKFSITLYFFVLAYNFFLGLPILMTLFYSKAIACGPFLNVIKIWRVIYELSLNNNLWVSFVFNLLFFRLPT